MKLDKQNTLNLTENMVAALEDLKLYPYRDSAGILSIGYGATTIYGRKVTIFDACTRIQAETWLRNRIEEDFNKLITFCNLHKVDLEDNEAAAILSFTYNAGFQSFLSSSMAKDLIYERKDKVTFDLLKWNKIRVDEKLTFSKGLFNRRMHEAQCFIDETACL